MSNQLKGSSSLTRDASSQARVLKVVQGAKECKSQNMKSSKAGTKELVKLDDKEIKAWNAKFLQKFLAAVKAFNDGLNMSKESIVNSSSNSKKQNNNSQTSKKSKILKGNLFKPNTLG